MSLVEGIDYYINDDGNFVFTEAYHLKRGYCCTNGCLHCPYGFRKEVKPEDDNANKNTPEEQ